VTPAAKNRLAVAVLGVVLVSPALFSGCDRTVVSPPELSFADTSEIHWTSHEEGLAVAAAEDKHSFVYFETSYCGWCRKMKQTTFQEADIVGMLNKHFVSVMVDANSQDTLLWRDSLITYRQLCRDEYQIRAVPTVWFLRPDGTKIGRVRGYQTAEALMPFLQYVAERRYDSSAVSPGGVFGGNESSRASSL
jgi:thioredoxin-related protein